MIPSGPAYGTIHIEDNAPDCNSPEELTEPLAGSCRFVVAADGSPEAGALALPAGPNLSASTVSVRFGLNAPQRVRLTVYDARGRLVTVLLDSEAAGKVDSEFDM